MATGRVARERVQADLFFAELVGRPVVALPVIAGRAARERVQADLFFAELVGRPVGRLRRQQPAGGSETVSEGIMPAAVADPCKAAWQAQVDALPPEVGEALASDNLELAVLLAIHHGLRDLVKLTDLTFFAKYGAERGFCKLRGDAADARYHELWKLRRFHVETLLKRRSPPVAQHGGVPCRRVERTLEDPRPDNPPVNITGRYYHRNKSTLNINQAGRHIEGHFTTVRLPSQPETAQRFATRVYGDLQADGSFLVFSNERPDTFWGHLRFERGRLTWQPEGDSEEVYTKYSDIPMFMASSRGGPDDLVYLQEWQPLLPAQILWLRKALNTDGLKNLLEEYLKTPAGSRSDEREGVSRAGRKLGKYLGTVFEDKKDGIHLGDMALGRYYARRFLTEARFTFKGSGQEITRSLLDWFQIALNVHADIGAGTIPEFEQFLALRPTKEINPTAPTHKYKASLSLKGVGWIGGYFRGEITIEKTTGKRWTETFKMTLKGFQAAPGFSISWSGEAESSHEWVPGEIPGSVELVEGSVGVKGPGVKVSGSAGFMHVFGAGYLPYLNFMSADVDADPSASGGFSIDKPDLTGRWGDIRSKSMPDVDYTTFKATTDYAVEYGLKGDVHFCLGSALLTEDGRQALRIMCGNELTSFMSPNTRLRIVGHTDRVDTEEHNLTLSAMRAENVLQALKDILGKSFAISDKNVEVKGVGENEAKAAGAPDEKPEPKFRRVDVSLDARLVISLRAS